MATLNHPERVAVELRLYGPVGGKPSRAQLDLAVLDEAKRIKSDPARYDAAIKLNRARTQQLLRNLRESVTSPSTGDVQGSETTTNEGRMGPGV